MQTSHFLESKKFPPLKDHEVHIWSLHIPNHETHIPYFQSILSEDERFKAHSFKFPKDQNRFLISRGVLRCLLGKYLGKDPQSVEILYGLWGKPKVLTEQPLYFNLSHSKDYALYAFTKTYEVGIDLEYKDPSFEVEMIASSLFSWQDVAYWKTLSPQEKYHTFFQFWVCKEAFLKASGKGWLDDQQAFSLTDIHHLQIHTQNHQKMSWPYYFEMIPHYASALFIEGPFLNPSYYAWHQNVYLSQCEPVIRLEV